ncbi:24592_t:CDS:2, partial [Gigaspora margarita]
MVLIPSLFAYSIPNSKYNKQIYRRNLNNNFRDDDIWSFSRKKRYADPNLKNLYRTRLSRRCISPISETAFLVPPPPSCDICAPPPCDICVPPPCDICAPPPCDICVPPPSPPPCVVCETSPPSCVVCIPPPPCGCKPPQVISHDHLSSNEFESCSENEHELQCCDESLGQKSYESFDELVNMLETDIIIVMITN